MKRSLTKEWKRISFVATMTILATSASGCGDDAAGGDNKPFGPDQCNPVCQENLVCLNGTCVSPDKICENKAVVCLDSEVCFEDKCTPADKLCENKTKVCKDSEICTNDVCTSTQNNCENNTKNCLDTEVCFEDKCTPADRVCNDALCPENQICFNGTCTDAESICGGTVVCTEGNECVENNHCEPIDKCRDVVCREDGTKCDIDTGLCRNRQICEDIICSEGQSCAETELKPLGECIDTACTVKSEDESHLVEMTCEQANQVCSNGTCVDDGCIVEGVPMSCPEAFECRKGECFETACIGKECNEGQTCSGGLCIDNECLPLDEHICPENQACSKGECIPELCVDKDPCLQGKVCVEDGTCQFETDPAILIEPLNDMTTDESGKTNSLILHLNNEPASDVTLTCEIVPEAAADEVDIDCSDIVINASNYKDDSYITITGQADNVVDGDQNYSIKITTHSEDPEFDGLTTTFGEMTNIDVDKASVNVNKEDGLMTGEDGTTTSFEIVLNSRPDAPVTIKVKSSDESEGKVTAPDDGVITINPDDWNKPVVVTVAGVEDDEADGPVNYRIEFEVSSDDPNYNKLELDPVEITNGDNDKAGINFPKDTVLQTSESGKSATVGISLATQPTVPVTAVITINAEAADEVAVTSQNIVWDSTNWNTPLDLTVQGLPDNIIDGDQPFTVTIKLVSDDPNYKDMTATISGSNADVDKAGVVLPTVGSSTVTEAGSSLNYTFTLSSRPEKPVKVTLSSSNPSEASVSPATITINPEDWNKPQTVTITGVDEKIDDGDQSSTIQLKLSSDDPNYNLTKDAWTITTTDDDTAGLSVTNISNVLDEDTGRDVLSIKLNSEPIKPVTITVVSGNSSSLTTSSGALTFDSKSWNVEQKVDISPVGNSIADGDRTVNVSISSASDDEKYDKLSQTITYTIKDNETPSVVIRAASYRLTPTALTTDLKVSLGQEPSKEVTVNLTSSSPVISLGSASVSFAPGNWAEKTVRLTANIPDANAAISSADISGKASSSGVYNNISSNKETIKVIAFENGSFNTTATGAVDACQSSLTLLPGTYKLQVWGASGGDGVNNDQAQGSHGGLGGYAEGILKLQSKQPVYLHYGTVGYVATYTYVGANAKGAGCNGGGAATGHSNGSMGYGGGGGSDIRIGEDTLYHRVIVAGGGGGADNASGTLNGSDDGSGGYGGGENGGKGKTDGTETTAGGSQTTGYAFGVGATYNSNYDIGGGGGGWYGGYVPSSDGNTGGGGGSGYVFTAETAKNAPSGFKLSSDFYLTNAKTTAGNAAFPAPSGSTNETGHKGNGWVKITLVE